MHTFHVAIITRTLADDFSHNVIRDNTCIQPMDTKHT